MSSYYSDDEDLDIHVSRRRAASPVHYVEPRSRVRPYYQGGTTLLMPERTVIATRARSRERSRERRSSSPSIAPPPPPQPVIINNKIYNEHSSDEEDHHHRMVVRSRRRSDSRSRSRSGFMTREDYEIERTRREIEELKVIQAREREERRSQKEYRDDAELRRAKLELDDIKRREARDDDEKRIKRELELQRLREEDRIEEEKQKLKRELELERLREEEKEEEEKKRREKEAKDAVEKYKAEEMEKAAKAQREKEERDADYRRRLQEDLINSGLDEKAIQAILKKEKLPEPAKETGRPTYTRMARRHLSIETLRTFHVDYDLDPDPEYILIKRWVPEWEQDSLWKHTRYIREKRTKTVLAIEDGHHKKHHHDTGLEWVRKKERKRSKSPALLMYLAGRQS